MRAALRSVRDKIPVMVGIGLLAFLGYKGLRLWETLPEYFWRGNQLFLGLSFLSAVLALFLAALGWQLILRVLGANMRWARSASIYFYSNLMRYAPGTFWYLPSRIHLCQAEGIGKEKSSVSLVLEVYFGLLSALLIGYRSIAASLGWPWIVTAVAVSVFLLLGLRSRVLLRFVNAILRRVRLAEIALDLQLKQMLLLLPPYVASWVFYGMGLWLLIGSLDTTSVPGPSTTIGIYAVSWAVGFLCLPVPQGIGVRDATLAYLLSNHMPFASASLVALAWRMWTLLAEIACTGLAAVLARVGRPG